MRILKGVNAMQVKTFRVEPYILRAIDLIRKEKGMKSNSEVIREAINCYVKEHKLDRCLPGEAEEDDE